MTDLLITNARPYGEDPVDVLVSDGVVGTIGTGLAAPEGAEVLTEEEVWRVVAANGRNGTHGVYELTHAVSTGAWRLSRVVD